MTKKPMVHIDQLFAEFQHFQSVRLNIMCLNRMGDWERKMDEERAKFKAFCDSHNLPIDWSKPE